jgi:hypothetical protein
VNLVRITPIPKPGHLIRPLIRLKTKKKYVALMMLLAICLFLAWFISEFLREWECHEYSAFKKANEIIQKIEDYRKCHGKLPDSLKDI